MVWNREHKLGSELMKTLCGKGLCKQINQLILGGYKVKMKVATYNTFTNEVVVNLNMFGAAMKNRIRGKCNGTSVITPHSKSSRQVNTKITQNLA